MAEPVKRHRKSEFYKIKDAFKPTLLNFTLWLAIASFQLSIALTAKPNNILWVLTVLNISTSEGLAYFIHFIIIVIFGATGIVASLCALAIFLVWLVGNTILLIINTYIKSKDNIIRIWRQNNDKPK